MIFDTIRNKHLYRDMPRVYQALEYLEALTITTLPGKRVDFEPDNKFFIVPKIYVTEPENVAPLEAHRLRIDIHYMLEGVEGIQTVAVSDERIIPDGEFRVSDDCGEFSGETDGTYWLRPGYFALCFPGEAHRTGIMRDEPRPIKKAVFKISM
jgi:YhcH/YjgK/YiaL family protein